MVKTRQERKILVDDILINDLLIIKFEILLLINYVPSANLKSLYIY